LSIKSRNQYIVSTEKLFFLDDLWIITLNKGIWYSLDGHIWSKCKVDQVYFKDIRFENGVFIGITAHNGLYYSEDGIKWEAVNTKNKNFTDIYYLNDKWYGNSYDNNILYSSRDGKNWTQINPNYNMYMTKFYYLRKYNIYLATNKSSRITFYSEDCQNWFKSSSMNGYLSDLYTCVGTFPDAPNCNYNTMYLGVFDSKLYWSMEGLTWTKCNIANVYSVNSVIYENNIFLVGTNDGLYYSYNGKDYEPLFELDGYNVDVTYANNKFYAIGYTPFVPNSNIIFKSDYGNKDWFKCRFLNENGEYITEKLPNNIIDNNIAYGSSGLFISKDGFEFKKVILNKKKPNLSVDNTMMSISFKPTRKYKTIVALTDEDGSYYSDNNGKTWKHCREKFLLRKF
jgi:hypothetical protein